MKTPSPPRLVPLLCLACLPVVATAQSNSKTDKDLQSVLALQGKDCGTVVGSERLGSNDYVATCSNGKRYRIAVDATGRVVITPQ